MPAARPTQRLIERTITAATKCGLGIAEVRVSADGTVRVIASGLETRLSSTREIENAWDRAQGESS